MPMRISLAAGEHDDLESLSEWLADERELAGLITFEPAVPAPGELGALSDVLVAAVSSGGAVSVLAASLTAWIRLPRRSDIRLKIQGADGKTVEIDAKSVPDDRLDALVQQILDSASPGE